MIRCWARTRTGSPGRRVPSESLRRVCRLIRLVIAAAFVALVIVMGSDNRTKVRVGYPGGHRVAAMWIVSVGASIAGVIIGWLIKHRPHHKI